MRDFSFSRPLFHTKEEFHICMLESAHIVSNLQIIEKFPGYRFRHWLVSESSTLNDSTKEWAYSNDLFTPAKTVTMSSANWRHVQRLYCIAFLVMTMAQTKSPDVLVPRLMDGDTMARRYTSMVSYITNTILPEDPTKHLTCSEYVRIASRKTALTIESFVPFINPL